MAMAEAVLCLLGDPALRERVMMGAQGYLKEYLTWEHLVKQVEAAYQ